MNNFENFLQTKHASQYTGLDDDMPDNFDHWLTELDVEQWIKFGDEFARKEQNAN